MWSKLVLLIEKKNIGWVDRIKGWIIKFRRQPQPQQEQIYQFFNCARCSASKKRYYIIKKLIKKWKLWIKKN